MKILIISATYSPSKNGVAISISQQKEEFEKRGHKVVVIAPHHSKEIPEKDVLRISSLPNPFVADYPFPIPVLSVSRFVRKIIKPDIVYFHHPFYIGRMSLKLASALSVPSVFFYHTQYQKYASDYIPDVVFFKKLPYIIGRHVNSIINESTEVIVETKSVAEELRNQGVTKKLNIIPTGRKFVVKTIKSREMLRKKFNIPINAVVILTVLRLSKEKNIDSLLRIFKKLNTSLPVSLIIVGEGPERRRLENYCSENSLRNIIFAGGVPFSHIHEFYQLADIFAYPSLSDTQAIVLVEAMSFGLPLLGFSAPGPIDFIDTGINGFIAENENEFTHYLNQLVTNPDLRRSMGHKSLEISKNYTFQNTMNVTESLFKKLINKTYD